MSYRHTLEAALVNLNEIEELVKSFPDKGDIPAIELDLALQKIRNLYELMLMMKGKETVFAAERYAESDIQERPQIKESEKKQVEVIKTVSEEVFIKEDVVTSNAIIVEETKQIQESDSGKTISVKTTSTKKTRENDLQTLADQFKGRPTLHESLHQTMKKDNSSFSHTAPVTDLMTAIAINDRFTLVRELFDDNNKAFESTIFDLNNAPSFNDAYNYMIQYFNWDMDSEPVQMLLDIIRRKFIKSRNE